MLQFDFTGAEQQFVVPAGISQISVELWGGQGGDEVGEAGNSTDPSFDGGAGVSQAEMMTGVNLGDGSVIIYW